MTQTNIKNLPPGNYFTEIGYSQSYPWVEIRRTANTVIVAKVLVLPDPEWKTEITPGGFCGHCHNQNLQTWLYGGVEKDRTMTLRKQRKKAVAGAWTHKGVRFVEGYAREFYDYNF